MIASILVALVVFFTDRVVKMYILENFALGEVRNFLPGVLQLTYHQNTGMAFSMLQNHQWVPLLLVPVILLVLGVVLARGMFPCVVQRLSLVALMAGGFGNWLDRILYGFVVDMFEPVFIRFAIFNVADIFIVLGGITFIVAYMLGDRKQEKSKKTSESADE